MRRGKRVVIGKKQAIIIAALCLVLAMAAGITWHEFSLRNAQQGLVSLMGEEDGNYNENKVVLSSTTPKEANEMADAFGGKLRITENGKFAVITLPDGMTLSDIAANKDFRKYHDKILLDYNNFGTRTEESETENAYNANNAEAETTAVSDDGVTGIRANYAVDDPMYPQQTYLDYLNIGNSWNNTRGKKEDGTKVKVAVIDTGIDTDHPEFYDADGNSIISTDSYDATNDKTVKQNDMSIIEDTNGHGTAVAGVIAAQMNDKGIAGIAPDVELLVMKCEANEKGEFKSSSDIVFAIYYAIEQDVDVINMSLGGSPSRDIEDALQLAVDSDIIPVASAGNDGTAEAHYPAAYDTTIGVGALESNSWELANYSNYGVNVDITAPGTALTTVVGGGYSYQSGTSISAPIVTAAVALYKAQDSYADFQMIKENLMAAGKDQGDLGEDYFYGYGALDMNAFLCEDKGTITYDYCTNEIESTSQIFVRQHRIQTVPEPERSKLVFDDWYYDKAYTKVFDYDAWYTTDFVEDVTLYAKWVNEDDEDASVYNYTTLSDGTIEISSYKGKRRYLTIPDTIDGKTVSSIGRYAFSGNRRLREVTFPEHLEMIHENAFRKVSGMRKIIFTGSNVKALGEWSFYGCTALRSVSVPDSVIQIGDYAFSGCTALTTVNISNNSQLTVFGERTFSNTGISYLYLPKGITSDGFDGSVLVDCKNVRGIEVASENSVFKVVNRVVFTKDDTSLVYYPAALGGTYRIPDTVKNVERYAFAGASVSAIELNSIETIGEYAFAQTTKLNEIILPETLTQLGEASFMSSSISKVTLSANLDCIPTSAFLNTNLVSVFVGANVKKICDDAFASCDLLKYLSFDENSQLEIIESRAFERCESLTNFTLPESLQKIGNNAFEFCSTISEINIPKNVTMIEQSAFQYCTGLQKVTFQEESILQKIDQNTFSYCVALKEVFLSENITILDCYAFSNCTMLSKIDFSDTSKLETVSDYCFYGDISLKKMQLPQDVKGIGEFAYAFSGLETAEITENISSIGNGAFGACASLREFIVDEGNAVYIGNGKALFDKNMQTVYCVSSAIVGDYTLPDSVQIVAPYAFYYDKLLSAISFPEGLQDIQHDAFYYCSSLSTIDIPSRVTNIGRKAFENCNGLTSVNFGENSQLQRLGIYTFVSCGFSEITIPSSVEEIAQYVFYRCSNLKKVIFEENSKLSYLSGYVFADTNIEQICFEEGSSLTSLQAHAFEGAYQLRNVEFGNANLENIDNYAFYNCDKLENIVLPNTVSSIGRYAFYNCAMMNRIDISATMNYIGTTAFFGTNSIKVYFEADQLPENLEDDWDKGIAGYFLQAREYVSNDEWEYIITGNNTVSLVRYKGNKSELNLETIDGYVVEKIGAQCFYDNDTLTSVTLGSELKEIGNYAFYGCDGIKTLKLPKSIGKIDDYAFADSQITITLPEDSSLMSIGAYAFNNNVTESLILPDSVITIGEGAFFESKLRTCEIGTNSKLNDIGTLAFSKTALQSVYLPESLSNVGTEAFKDTTEMSHIEIADGSNVLKLSNSAFEGSGFTSIIIPERVSYIGEYTFAGCQNLENINVEESNKSYSDLNGVLCDSSGTTLIQYPCGRSGVYEVPQSVTTLTYASFKDAKKLTEVSFAPNSTVRTIGWKTFSGCESLAKISVPDTVVSFDYYAFENCTKLSDVILSETSQLTGVYEGAFYGCTSLCSILLPDTVEEIGEYAFYNCASLASIPMKETAQVKGIYDYAFYGCTGIEAIPYFSQLKEVGAYAFANTSVTEYLVPASVTQIATTAFSGCEHLLKIECEEANEVYTSLNGILYEKGVSDTEDMDAVVIWPFGKKIILGEGKTELTQEDTAMFALDGSGGFPFKIAETVTKIGDFAFANRLGLTNIEIPATVSVIGENAFQNCSNLQNITLNEGLTEIQNDAFWWCTGLKNIVIPNSVKKIGMNAFLSCHGLQVIVIIGDTLPEASGIGHEWYNGHTIIFSDSATDLKYGQTSKGYTYVVDANHEVTILEYKGKDINPKVPAEIERMPVVTIGGNAFANRSDLTSVFIPDGIKNMGAHAFDGCTGLKKITIPGSVTAIGEYAFANCTSLQTAILENGVQTLGTGLFEECSNLSRVVIPESAVHIGDNIFYWTSKLKTAGPIGGGYNVEFGWKDEIPSNAFFNCYYSIETVVIPDGIQRIGSSAFSTYSIKKITIPASVIEVGYGAFSGIGCRTAGPIGGGYDYEFGWNETIPENALDSCNNLTSIFIPKDIKNIENIQFRAPHYLQSFDVDINNKSYCSIDGVLFSKDKSVLIAYPKGKAGGYIIPDDVKKVQTGAFYDASKMTSLIIADSVISMGEYPFWECYQLKLLGINSPDVIYSLSNPFNGTKYYGNMSIIIPTAIKETSDYIVDNFKYIDEIVDNGISYTIYSNHEHNWQEKNDIEYIECKQDGITTKLCTMCNIEKIERIAAHDLGEWTVSKAATCTEAGEKVRSCSRCDYIEKEEIAAIGHVYEEIVTAPTCTEAGYTTYTCKVCGDSYIDGEIAAVGHKYEEIVTAPTCTEDGYTTHTCKVCGDSYVDHEVGALDHDLGEWTVSKAATCTEAGEKVRSCSRCDYREREEIAALGHKYEEVVTAPTCTEAGYTTHTCKVCGDSYVDSEVAALGHDLGEWTVSKEATCTEAGEKVRSCSRCAYSEREEISAIGHVYEEIVTAPTCTEGGYTTHTCKVCGDRYVDHEVTALGHDLGAWTVSKAATCTESGEKVRKCSRCDYSESEEIAATGHHYVDGSCTNCGQDDPNKKQESDDSYSLRYITVDNRTAWYYANDNGEVDRSYTNVITNGYGWWYVRNGEVDFNYTGLAQNESGWWRIVNGAVDFTCTSVVNSEYGWWFVRNGQIDFTYTGLAQNENGWWRIVNGTVDFTCTSVVNSEYGWWFVRNGQIDFTYTGLAQNENGWWRIVNGTVDFNCTSVVNSEYGWWFVRNGQIDFAYTGVAQNEFGWWRIENGALNFNFNGLAQNEYGWWYIKNGMLDFSYTGYVNWYGTVYRVQNGQVIF